MSAYREEVLRTSPNFIKNSEQTNLNIGAMGLAGETGEVVDLIKKSLFHGKELNVSKLVEELGDVRWYLEYLAASIGVEMDFIEEMNVKKLRIRYPNGFNFEDANRGR